MSDWSQWPVGVRVVVRRKLVEGGWSDVLGELVRRDETGVLIRSRWGDVEVRADEIAIGKIVPPAPPRRPPRDR